MKVENTSSHVLLHLFQQQSQPESGLSKGNAASRGGFNLSDFSDSQDEAAEGQAPTPALESGQQQSNCGLTRLVSPIDFFLHRERVYAVVESTVVALVLLLILIVDVVVFALAYIDLLNGRFGIVQRVHRVMDYVTSIFFFVQVHARLYSYGPFFYFRSEIRASDYFVTLTCTILFISSLIVSNSWLFIMRLIRLLRVSTLFASWTEQKVKLKATHELEQVADILERDQLQAKGLTKWKLDSQHILIGERVGHGGFGTVFSGLFRATLVAVKQIPNSEREEHMSSIEDEAITLVNLRHPNVVLFMGFVCEPSKLWIVTEYCSRASLRDVLDDQRSKFSEGKLLRIALGAARGLAYLHGQNPPLLHLDLKTSNILISAGWEAKLADFGLSRNVTNIERDCFSATMQYCAPEILEANVFSTAADIYSFGVCLWELATREVPFADKSPTDVLWGVVKSGLRPPIENIVMKEEAQPSASLNRGFASAAFSQSDHRNTYITSRHTQHLSERALKQMHNVQLNMQPLASESVAASSFSATTSNIPLVYKMDPQILHEAGMDKGRQGGTGERSNAETQNVKDQTIQAGYFGYGEERREDSPRSLSALQRKPSSERNTSEKASQISDLTRRVTATIKKLDDRPPIARRKEVQNQLEISRDGSMVLEEEGVISTPNLARVIRQTFKSRLNLGDALAAGARDVEAQEASRVPKDKLSQNEVWNDKDAFARRMENFARREFEGAERKAGGGGIGEEGDDDGGGNVKTRVRRRYVDLIERCWAQDPKHRPSASQVVWDLVSLIKEAGSS